MLLHATQLSLLTLGGRALTQEAEEPERMGYDVFSLYKRELGTSRWEGKAVCKTSHSNCEEVKNSKEIRISAMLFG